MTEETTQNDTEARPSEMRSTSLLANVVQIAKYLAWQNDVGDKLAEKIISEIHAGKYGDKQGLWVQVDNAMNQIAANATGESRTIARTLHPTVGNSSESEGTE